MQLPISREQQYLCVIGCCDAMWKPHPCQRACPKGFSSLTGTSLGLPAAFHPLLSPLWTSHLQQQDRHAHIWLRSKA